MIIDLFIVLCVTLFFLITIYTLFIIIFGKKIIDLKGLFYTLNKYSMTVLFLMFFSGLFFLFFFLIIKSDFYIKSIKTITNDSGLGGIGDFFNGLITPIISIVSIIYIYKAFVQQFRANEMLYNFEYRKNIKEDLDWLRDNNSFLKNLEFDINNKDKNELDEYFVSNKIEVKKLIYSINIFKNIFKNVNEKENELSQNALLVLTSFYLSTYKSIFRDINDYMRNSFQDNSNYYIDHNKIEIEYAKNFIELYQLVSVYESDKSFKFTFDEAKNNITNGKA